MMRSFTRKAAWIIPILFGALIATYSISQTQTAISPAELAKWLKEKPDAFVLLDVRTPEEHAEAHIPGTDLNIDYRLLKEKRDELPPKDAVIVVYCRSGHRSAIAYETLKAMGYEHLFNLEGGIRHWVEQGFPVESSRSSGQ